MRLFSRKSIFHALGPFQARRESDRRVGVFLSTLIVLNVVATILQTVESIDTAYHRAFLLFEVFSVFIFVVEYVLRFWVAAEHSPDNPLRARVAFMLSPMGLIDLMAIVPFFLPLIFHVDLRYLRALRLFRIIRVLKLGRYSNSMNLLSHVLRSKVPELAATTSVGAVLLTVSSSAMYFFEHEAQPEAFSSIPASMWWAISTLTTVGYGDIYPVTVGGKIFGSLVALIGVGLVAIPTGILGAGLIDSVQQTSKKAKRCAHCGQSLKNTQRPAA